jgi:thymidylate synthase
MISIIFATNKNNVFSQFSKLGLPWGRYAPDLKFFYAITNRGTSNICIMGRKTYESIPKLENRKCFVVTSRLDLFNEATTFPSLQFAIEEAKRVSDNVSIIGGRKLIYEALKLPYEYEIFHSIIPDETKYEDEELFSLSRLRYYTYQEEKSKIYNLIAKGLNVHYYKYSHPETEYLNLIKHVLSNGVYKTDRTNTGVLSCSGLTLEIPLTFGFPLLTTKKVSFHAIKEELLWFISGCTDNKVLKDNNIHIWDGNSSAEFHKLHGLDSVYSEDDCGPIYSFQYRHWGAEYKTCKEDYTNQGIDQLKNVIESLKSNPDSRRHIVSAWNVSDLKKMTLPPCHSFYQFYTSPGTGDTRELHCMLYQRSSDIGLGLPYNIASYALLTEIVGNICGYKPKKLTIFIGDAHIYMNHVTALTKQTERFPMDWPTLEIKRNFTDIDDVKTTDFALHNYTSHPFIAMKMAV